MALLSFFPSYIFLSLFFLIFQVFRSLCQRVVLLNLLDIKVNPNYLLFSQRESESESETEKMSRRSPVVRGWSGGAMLLGKRPVPRRPANLDNSRARAYCACSRCGWGLFGHFKVFLSFLLSFSLFRRRSDID